MSRTAESRTLIMLARTIARAQQKVVREHPSPRDNTVLQGLLQGRSESITLLAWTSAWNWQVQCPSTGILKVPASSFGGRKQWHGPAVGASSQCSESICQCTNVAPPSRAGISAWSLRGTGETWPLESWYKTCCDTNLTLAFVMTGP